MNAQIIIQQLQGKYPNKNIVKLPENNPTEIICEAEPTSEHPNYSKAIAVIDQSLPHFHTKSTEEYTIIKGTLIITKEGKDYTIPEGQSFIIYPMEVHSAKGDATWAEVISVSGWTPDDHIIKE